MSETEDLNIDLELPPEIWLKILAYPQLDGDDLANFALASRCCHDLVDDGLLHSDISGNRFWIFLQRALWHDQYYIAKKMTTHFLNTVIYAQVANGDYNAVLSLIMVAAMSHDRWDIYELFDLPLMDFPFSEILQYAVQKGQFEVCDRIFYDEQIDLAFEDLDLLSIAIEGNHYDIFDLLIEHGADINIYRDAPLRTAVTHNRVGMTSDLIDAGADVAISNNTPLRIAAENGFVEMFQLLLDAGGDPHDDEDEVIKIVLRRNQKEMVSYMLNFGIDLFTEGEVAIEEACTRRLYDIAKLIITANEDQIVGAKGSHLLRLAKINRHEDIVDLLRAVGAELEQPLHFTRPSFL